MISMNLRSERAHSSSALFGLKESVKRCMYSVEICRMAFNVSKKTQFPTHIDEKYIQTPAFHTW